nr:glycosyl transferase family 2 [Mangrovicella endophytica]
MLSVFIEAGSDAGQLAQSLASLVPGAVEGLVREVLVIEDGLGPDGRKVADHAGCRLVANAELPSVLPQAKGDWLMLIEPGARLLPGWIEALGEHIADVERGVASPEAARFSPSRLDRLPFLQRVRQRRGPLADGLVLRKSQALGLVKRQPSLNAMARGLATSRLRAEIRPPVAARQR